MQKKNRPGNEKVRPDAADRYYDLKTSAIDDLVNAKPGKARTYSMEELGKYRSRKGIRVAEWLKILFIKAWFSGAVCFFFLWGLGIYIRSLIDMLFILGMAMGFVTDMLVNSMIRFIEKTPGANHKWMMFPQKSFAALVCNIVYSYVILFLVYTTYTGVNVAITTITSQPDTVPLGVEPILFGLLCTGFDLLLVGMKQLFLRVVRDARNKVEGKK